MKIKSNKNVKNLQTKTEINKWNTLFLITKACYKNVFV